MAILQTISRFTQTFIEQRRSLRQPVQFPAWIDLGNGSEHRECTVLDVSDGGARLMVASPGHLPKEFWLLLTRSGARRRRCKLVWRSDVEIGVRYLGAVEANRPPESLN